MMTVFPIGLPRFHSQLQFTFASVTCCACVYLALSIAVTTPPTSSTPLPTAKAHPAKWPPSRASLLPSSGRRSALPSRLRMSRRSWLSMLPLRSRSCLLCLVSFSIYELDAIGYLGRVMLMGWWLQRLFRERVRDFSGCSVIGFGFCLREFDIRDIDVTRTAMIELEGPTCIMFGICSDSSTQ